MVRMAGQGTKNARATPQEEALERTAPLLDDELLSEHVKLPKAAALVAQRLRRQIVRGELGENDPLPSEGVLVERFNVSRPTLREAFRVLESENLITIRRGARGGARVQVPDGEIAARQVGLVLEYRGASLLDVYAAREEIEASSVRLLAKTRTKADVRALQTRQEEIEELALPNPMRFAHSSLTFHQLVVELTRNQTLAVLDSVINRILLRSNESAMLRTLGKGGERLNQAAHDEHGVLIQRIEEKDADGAENLWRRHCTTWSRQAVDGEAALTVVDLLGD